MSGGSICILKYLANAPSAAVLSSRCIRQAWLPEISNHKPLPSQPVIIFPLFKKETANDQAIWKILIPFPDLLYHPKAQGKFQSLTTC